MIAASKEIPLSVRKETYQTLKKGLCAHFSTRLQSIMVWIELYEAKEIFEKIKALEMEANDFKYFFSPFSDLARLEKDILEQEKLKTENEREENEN